MLVGCLTLGRWFGVALLGTVLTVTASQAAPWQAPGDLLFRHDLALLADEGGLAAPITSWPVSFANIQESIAGMSSAQSPILLSTIKRMREKLRVVRRPGFRTLGLKMSLAGNPSQFRIFLDSPREKSEMATASEYLGQNVAARLEVHAVEGSDDGDRIRFDGSFLAGTLGNWILSLGAQDRWWGPGWDGSLILSTNARPIPALSFSRKSATPSDLPVLRLLGPWNLSCFVGLLDDDRFVSDAKLLGLRLSFKPINSLELGFSRTAQWGGDGRPQDVNSLTDLFLGRNNVGDDGVDKFNEPGNELGGIDFRLKIKGLDGLHSALYGQFVAEDEAGGFPSRFIGLGGVEAWGGSPLGGSFRAYLEWADTRTSFYNSEPTHNYAYEHNIYKSGYRYEGQSLGHSLDNDGKAISMGLFLVSNQGEVWGVHLLSAILNEDGTDRQMPAGNTMSNSERKDIQRLLLFHDRKVFGGRLGLQLGMLHEDAKKENRTKVLASAAWSRGFL